MSDTIPIQSRHLYEGVWRQPEDVDRLLRTRAEGYTLNLCSGESPLGDVQVDVDRNRSPDIQADMCDLPFAEATFDTVIWDPPWKLEYYDRQSPFFEAVRVTKPNGLILMNALWIGESQNTTIDGPPIIRADDEWANVSVIVPHRKQRNQTTLDNRP